MSCADKQLSLVAGSTFTAPKVLPGSFATESAIHQPPKIKTRLRPLKLFQIIFFS